MSDDGEKRLGRSDFRHFRAVPTRWEDSDAYGHVKAASAPNDHIIQYFARALSWALP